MLVEEPSSSFSAADDYGWLSPKNLQMKDLYVKTRMQLTTNTPMEAHQAFADYRYQDTDNYWRFGLNQIPSYEFKGINLSRVKKLLKHPIIVDGRNLFDKDQMRKMGFAYTSVGR